MTPGAITIDLGYDTWYGGRSVRRVDHAVPANVDAPFGLLYACPGGTSRTWRTDALAHVSYMRYGKKLLATYAKTGPKATFRC